jgi:uncharacterized membrane protein YfcA
MVRYDGTSAARFFPHLAPAGCCLHRRWRGERFGGRRNVLGFSGSVIRRSRARDRQCYRDVRAHSGRIRIYWVYRDRLLHGWRLQTGMALTSVVGAWIGSELLLHTSEQGFARLVPYLMLVATLIFSFAGRLRNSAASHAARTTHYVPLVAGQFLIAIYGGYFGAGMGVLMLTLYLLAAHLDMHQASGVRLLCGTATNTIATLVFAARGIIQWPLGVPLIFACAAGGYWGARLVKRMDPEKARRAILAYAWAVTIWLLAR